MSKKVTTNSITKQLTQKVYNYIYDLLEKRTTDNKLGKEDSASFEHVALARDLSSSDVIEYIQQADFKMRRMKQSAIIKIVDPVLLAIKEHENSELGPAQELVNEEAGSESEKFEQVDEANLMDEPVSNDFNKSLVKMWNIDDPKGDALKGQGSKSDNVDLTNETEGSQEPLELVNTNSKKRIKETKIVKAKKTKISHTPPSTNLSSLGGLESVTKELMELVGLPMQHAEIYGALNVEPPRGVLLYGPPGCGKTSIATALAGELKVPFINISAPSIVSGMSGESEKKLREIFEEAKSLAPCIIFLDEIDAITPKRDGGAQREMEKRIVAQLLTLMDELSFEKTGGKPVVVIGATNRPDSLDSALRRAGRFDREICLNVPNETQRCSILKSMTANMKLQNSEEFNYWELAKMTPGFVGADLKSLVTAAGITAIKRIFESLSEIDQITEDTPMEIDDNVTLALQSEFVKKSDQDQLSTIQKFLVQHPDPLTSEQLAPLSIGYQDFLTALPTIQPTAKREGFATVPDVSWANVGALKNIRMELHMCIVQPIRKPEIYLKVGITAPAGVLMWGPPGCGKTLLAKAVANESRANFISVKGPELLNKYVGESERAVRQVFQRAKASIPCIIFFDELDALVPRRDTSLSESSSRVVNTLLTELDGLNDRKGVFVIGATNRPDMIDPAMIRPGRLDKTLYIELPSATERFEILKTLVKANNTPLDENVDLQAVAANEKCRNFSGADLSSLVREAGVIALKKKFFKGHELQELEQSGYYQEDDSIDDNNITVTIDDFNQALSSIKPSVSDRDRAKYERLNKKMGWSVVEESNDATEAAASS